MSRGVVGPIALIALLAAACRRDEQPHAAFVRDSAGITIVESRDPVWGATDAWTVATTPTLSIGAEERGPQYELSAVRGVVELSDGRIVVANAGTLELRCYRADGTFLWASGHRGQGPGDFATISSLARYRGDSVLVHDASQRRYSVIDPSGRFARSWAPSLPDDSTFSGSLGFGGVWEDGSIAILDRPVRRGMSPPQVTRRPTRLFRYGPTGDVLGRLGAFPGAEYYEGEGHIGSIRALPFGRNTAFAPAGDHTFVGNSASYEIRRLRQDGTIERLIRRAFPPRAVTPQEVVAERDRLREARRLERPKLFEGMPESRLAVLIAGEEKTFDELPFPPAYPVFANLVVARDGYLWVQEFTTRVDSAGDRWSVFDSDGRWLGDVRLPPRFTLYEVTADHVLGVQTDEFDVPFVRAFQRTRSRE